MSVIADAVARTSLPIPRHYQQEGAEWIASRLSRSDTRAVMLCDDPGLGKTRQALMASELLGADRICILSPAGARRVWLAEINRWFPAWADRVVLVEPGGSLDVRVISRPTTILLVSFDAVASRTSHIAEFIRRVRWDLLIIDEAHYLKNRSARTLAVYGPSTARTPTGIQASAKRVLLLTGSPTPNHAGELWQHCRTFWQPVLLCPEYPDTPMPEHALVERVCIYTDDPVYGRRIRGSKDTAWLREKLRPYVLHRSKRAVLPELPPLTEQDIPLDMTAEDVRRALADDERTLERDLCRQNDEELWRAIRSVSPDDTTDTLPLASLRRRLSELKLPGTVEWIDERLSCGVRKIIVFGWHVATLEALQRLLIRYNTVLITGKTPPTARDRLCKEFQNNPTVRVFIGQIRAAGTAITLNAASDVCMMEPSWVPGENMQAIDRSHRLGQPDHVLATYLYLPGTLDQRVLAVARRKAADIRQLLPA